MSLVTRHFLSSLHGISHNKIEDTKEEHLAMAVSAFDKLADKATRWIERSVARQKCTSLLTPESQSG